VPTMAIRRIGLSYDMVRLLSIEFGVSVGVAGRG
jgi:hypothetical protein